jgi:ABC-type sugar transport system substrate-binding protein
MKSRNWPHAAVAACLAVLLTACGSASSGSTGTTVGTATDSAGVADAQAWVTKYETRPTTINVKDPVSKAVPRGKSLVFISCGNTNCNLESDIIKTATDKLGWTLQTINTNGSPEQVKAAWTQVVRTKPTGVLYTAQPRSVFESELKQATANGTFVAACCTTDAATDGIDYVIGDQNSNAQVGKDLAALVTVQAKGQANALYVDLPVFPILTAVKTAYEAALKQWCAACASDTMDMPLTSLGKDAPDKIVSYLRAHPKVKTVVLSVDSIGNGLPAALKAAGLQDIYIVGEGPDTTVLQYMKQGLRGPTNAFPYWESMFAMVDAVVRHVVGDPVDAKPVPVDWIVTKDNMPTAVDITVAELAIESFFPADAATAEVVRAYVA